AVACGIDAAVSPFLPIDTMPTTAPIATTPPMTANSGARDFFGTSPLYVSDAAPDSVVGVGPFCVVGPLRCPVLGRCPWPVGVRAPPSGSIIVPPECDVDAEGAGSPCHVW